MHLENKAATLSSLLPGVFKSWRVYSSPKLFPVDRSTVMRRGQRRLPPWGPMKETTHFFFVTTFSTNTSTHTLALKSRMNRGLHSSWAIPRSLQHRINALDLAPSLAVATPDGSKYSCSPLAVDTNLLMRGDKVSMIAKTCQWWDAISFFPSPLTFLSR
jgi:hypothetical protein